MQKTVPVLPALDMNETIIFYRDKLNFSIVNYGNYIIAYNKNAELHFFESGDKYLCKNSSCYILVNNIEDFYASLSAKDIISPDGQLQSKPWNMKEFSILDNNGNLLRFGEKIK